MEKKELRKIYLEKRKYENPKLAGEIIAKKIVKTDIFKSAKTVFVYLNAKGEVSTDKLIEICFLENKKVCVPVVLGDDMNAAFITSDTVFVKDIFGISEPEEKVYCTPNDIDLIITPGVAFNKKGYRIGYGKGYYDRFFKTTNAYSIGICFSSCISEEFIPESHDIAVNSVVTECDIYE